MTTHDDIHRDMGRMEGRLEAVNDHLGKIDKTLESIDQRLAKIESREIERRGAWKVIVLVAGSIGGAVAMIANFLLGRVG
ncbi:hypothetical protein [Novosphingobium sp. KN65.2]|uniref:hypothetical protein n=1 Tax=Novosphingobium sp. KN65.2 TaxID=1478134 RepID=UPI0005E061EC|nr:hypothetical protein [Novosphingobium sp. KN65.2]CDO34560.1 hypothetical protein SPHV1_1670010 [Novosphingobium sp. KN65.2]